MSEHTPDDIFKLVKDENIEYVDTRVCDLPGTTQHFTIPITSSTRTCSRKAWPSTVPRFEGSN